MSRLKDWAEQGLLSREAVEKLQAFAGLIHAWNPKINLTGYRSVEEIEFHLVEESLAALFFLGLQNVSILDFGSGAGVPGLIWALCNSTLRVTSLEIRQKKIAFQKEALRQFGMTAEILGGHFPEAVAGRKFDLIVSRAIRLESQVWQESRELLSGEGRIVRFATPGTAQEGWRTEPITPRTALLISC